MTVARALNFNEYEKYKQKQLRANEELSMTHDNDDMFESITVITSVRYPDAPPRIFHNDENRCGCVEQVKDLAMCCHEIKAKRYSS